MFEAKFQTFTDEGDRTQSAARLAALRAELKKQGLDAFLFSRADEHQNEYVPPSEERVAWLTGFTGSAAIVAILPDKAALFTDGRYTLQAKDQIDSQLFSIEHMIEKPASQWLSENLPAGAVLGYDPWRTTADGVERLEKAAKEAGSRLAPVKENPIDKIWRERPAPPLTPVVLHGLQYSGEEAASKIARIREVLAKDKIGVAVLSDPASIAWTFNIRGNDVAHTPLPLSWAILPREGEPQLFVDSRKLSNEVRDTLAQLADVREPRDLEVELHEAARGKTVRLDSATAPSRLAEIVKAAGGNISKGSDPVTNLKAIKNETEIAGMRAAHLRDGAALTRYLAWLDREAPGGNISEIDAVAALETFRRETGVLKDVSFPTISGAGPNGAIVHYRVTEATNRKLEKGELFLVDSGAQYEDGTTDVTRTIAIGEPSQEMRERFTLVLKGHIAVARATFPEGTSGAQLDPFARRALWEAGLDFDHGTGHGVGSYLSVHEGPARISKLGNVPLLPSMILSNEPGYYKTGSYGIRIENLLLVERRKQGIEKQLLGFETLTFAPIDLTLIEPTLLSFEEIAWLNGYHAQVREKIGPQLDPQDGIWLEQATAPIVS
ncbi:MAG TPA: aminopeptidase P family protein [Xanthobacteraceae bacterium]|nr:aminopeptidase P family protein [Xanthobacteraceae bacterium]